MIYRFHIFGSSSIAFFEAPIIVLQIFLSLILLLWTSQASSQASAAGTDPPKGNFSKFLEPVWRFLRPHTIRGTALGSV